MKSAIQNPDTNDCSVRKAVVNALPKNVCYRSWWRQTKLLPNESVTPTLKLLRVDPAPPLRGAGLCAAALGAWRLGAVTPIANTAADARPSGPEHV